MSGTLGWPGRSQVAAEGSERCPQCGQVVESGETFCTHCGTQIEPALPPPLPVLDAALDPDEPSSQTHAGAETEQAPVPARKLRRPTWPTVLASCIALAALAGGGVAAYLWQQETSERERTQGLLEESHDQLAALKREQTTLESQLAEARALAAERADLLGKAGKALRGVDNLLTSVDELQGITGEMQEARASYSAASEDLKADLILLANYLLDVDPYYANWAWVSSMISQINGEISSVNYYVSTLDGYDGDYSRSSERFQTRATTFTTAVRAFQKRLEEMER